MRLTRLLVLCLVTLPLASSGASRIHRGPTAAHHKVARGKKKTVSTAAAHPRAIDDQRATEIQAALVKAGYLQEVTGHWDNSSQAAMQKLQSDNGWQTKLIPDSRALIKLGLGPGAHHDSGSTATPASAEAIGAH